MSTDIQTRTQSVFDELAARQTWKIKHVIYIVLGAAFLAWCADGVNLRPREVFNAVPIIADYFARMRTLAGAPFEPMVGVIDAPSASRLEQFFNAQVAPYDHANIDDSDWSDVLLSFQIKTTLGLPCIDAKLVEPFDCAFSATTGARETVLPTCDASAANRPCYQLAPHEGCVEGSRVYVKVSWLAWPEYGTHVTGQCVAETPSN